MGSLPETAIWKGVGNALVFLGFLILNFVHGTRWHRVSLHKYEQTLALPPTPDPTATAPFFQRSYSRQTFQPADFFSRNDLESAPDATRRGASQACLSQTFARPDRHHLDWPCFVPGPVH